jgi:2-hydroxyacyl-CoA lyase 1
MELETAARAKLPLIIIVINNNGIYHGLDKDDYQESRTNNSLPSTALSPDTRYDLIAEACGGRGWLTKNRKELREAMAAAMATKDTTCLINAVIAPGGRTKLVSIESMIAHTCEYVKTYTDTTHRRNSAG